MTWFKVDEDGTIIDGGTRVIAPGYELGPDGQGARDGWFWRDSGTVGPLTVTAEALATWEAANKDSSINSIAKMKAANLAFIAAILAG